MLRVRATRVGSDTMLAGIIRLVEQAQGSKAPIQRLADTVSGVFVPAVLVLALLTFIGWTVAGYVFGFAPAATMGAAMASPWMSRWSPRSRCWWWPAPARWDWRRRPRSWSARGSGAELGVLFKGGESLERLEKVDAVVLDKTGTITRGKPALTDVRSSPRARDLSEHECCGWRQARRGLGASAWRGPSSRGRRLAASHWPGTDDSRRSRAAVSSATVDGRQILLGTRRCWQSAALS